MGVFNGLYNRVMQWSRAPHASWYLAGLSFAESSFFPIPPDVMLAPMSMAEPKRAWRLAALTTAASVIGGMLGYSIGYFAFESIQPWIQELGYWDKYLLAKSWFDEWGFWAIFLAGFSPIPYKVFTIASGSLGMAIPPFLVASAVGRGARFFLVAGLLAWGGPRLEQALRRYIERIGWLLVAAALIAYAVLQGNS
jgi:membrane protein YqaA with SNARE-associated domain